MKGLFVLCLLWVGDAIYGIVDNHDMYSFKKGGMATNVISLVVSALLLPVPYKVTRARDDKERFDFLYEHDADFREQVELNAWYARAEQLKREEAELFNQILSNMRATENHDAFRDDYRQAHPESPEGDIDIAFVASFLRASDRSDEEEDVEST